MLCYSFSHTSTSYDSSNCQPWETASCTSDIQTWSLPRASQNVFSNLPASQRTCYTQCSNEALWCHGRSCEPCNAPTRGTFYHTGRNHGLGLRAICVPSKKHNWNTSSFLLPSLILLVGHVASFQKFPEMTLLRRQLHNYPCLSLSQAFPLSLQLLPVSLFQLVGRRLECRLE